MVALLFPNQSHRVSVTVCHIHSRCPKTVEERSSFSRLREVKISSLKSELEIKKQVVFSFGHFFCVFQSSSEKA